MSIRLHMIGKSEAIALDVLDFGLQSVAASQTNAVFARYTPGFPFVITGVRWYSNATTNLTSVDVGTAPTAGGTYTSVLSAQITPSADAERVGALITTTGPTSALYGTATSQIVAKYTSGTGPTVTNGTIYIIIRPRPMDGDPVF